LDNVLSFFWLNL